MPSVLIKVKKIYLSCFTSYVQYYWNITFCSLFCFFFPAVACLPTRHFYFMPTLIIPLCDPMDCSPPGASVHGILQARILESVAILFSRGSSWPRDWTWAFCIAGTLDMPIWKVFFNLCIPPLEGELPRGNLCWFLYFRFCVVQLIEWMVIFKLHCKVFGMIGIKISEPQFLHL